MQRTAVCNSIHAYEVRPRKDKRGVDLISDALPFSWPWYAGPSAVPCMELSDTCEVGCVASLVVTQQLQRDWDCRERAHGNQRPADSSPLLTRQLFRKQQRDARTEHCTRGGQETDLRNRDFVLFHLSFPRVTVVLLDHTKAR